MKDTQPEITTIKTEASETINFIVRSVAQNAGLAVIRGPVGIGKSHTLLKMATDLEEEIRIVYIRSRPEIEGSVLAFASAVLEQFSVHETRTDAAVQALETLLAGYPFLKNRIPCVLAVDEAQGLKTNVLEMLRALWDAGQPARDGNQHHPSFGLVLCGNRFSLRRTGRMKELSDKQWGDRIDITCDLNAPPTHEFQVLAQSLCGCDAEATAALAEYGAARGSFRSMVSAYRYAAQMADGERITQSDIKRTIFMKGDLK